MGSQGIARYLESAIHVHKLSVDIVFITILALLLSAYKLKQLFNYDHLTIQHLHNTINYRYNGNIFNSTSIASNLLC